MNIGSKIRAKRKSQKLTLERLSKISGVSASNISRLERGLIVDTGASKRDAIYKALGMEAR